MKTQEEIESDLSDLIYEDLMLERLSDKKRRLIDVLIQAFSTEMANVYKMIEELQQEDKRLDHELRTEMFNTQYTQGIGNE